VTDGQEALLDRRRAALDAYLDFEDTMAGGDRAEVPVGIRYAMSDWDFGTALRAIDRAAGARQRLDELGGRAAALGLVLPAHLESMYLDADPGFGRLTSSLDATATVLEALEGRADALSPTDQANFSLGRFDRLDPALFPPDQGTVLDQDLDGASNGRWYLLASGVLVLALVVTAVAAVGLPQDDGPLAGPPTSAT
jgi:hypothetical protein